MKINMPQNVQMILEKLNTEGYESVVIGGCVRDTLMGKEPHDWDIATSAQPEEIMKCFENYNLMTAGLKHGTVTVIIDHEPYEITTYRIDGKYTDFRRPDSVDFTTDLAKDIMRRDFTINAIAYDGEEIIDLHDGIGDMQRGLIRCVGNPGDRFQEDPLRILRAIRFSARFGFKIDRDTKAAMFDNMHLLEKIAMERKQSEFSKAICSENVDSILDFQDILAYVMPGLSEVKEWTQLVRLLNESDNLCVKLAFMLDAFAVNDVSDVVEILSRIMKYPNKTVKSVCNIISAKNELIVNSDVCIKRLLFRFPAEDVRGLYEFKYAKIKECTLQKENCGVQYELYSDVDSKISKIISDNECYNFKGMNINGHDLKKLGIKDVEIKTYLTQLLDLIITGQLINEKGILIETVKNSQI